MPTPADKVEKRKSVNTQSKCTAFRKSTSAVPTSGPVISSLSQLQTHPAALGRGRCGDIATGRGFHQLGLLFAVWGCAPAAYRLNPVRTACWFSVEEKRGEGEREVRKEEMKRKNVQEKIGVNHCNRKMD